MKDISVVIPLYDEAESLPELEAWLRRVLEGGRYSYELLFVDDGSDDASWQVIRGLQERNERVKGIRLRRNYGKSAALNVGFRAAGGKVVITMDADLQDSPDEIPELYRKITEEGYDIVSGWKKKRYDPPSKTLPTKLFNAVTRRMSGIRLHDFNCGLKAYRLEVVKNIQVYGEMHRYIPVLAKWSGFRKIGEQVVEHRPRKYGYTKFGMGRFIKGFLDLVSIFFVGKFSKRPMHFFGTLGVLAFLFGFIVAVWLIGEKLYHISMELPYRNVTDQPLFFLAMVAIVVGVQLFMTGFLAEMISRNSFDSNSYQIAERTGFFTEELS